MTTVIRVCDICRKSFKPQLSDTELRTLWLSEEDQVYLEELEEYPSFVRKNYEPHIPRQTTCGSCFALGLKKGMWGGIDGPEESIEQIRRRRLMPPLD